MPIVALPTNRTELPSINEASTRVTERITSASASRTSTGRSFLPEKARISPMPANASCQYGIASSTAIIMMPPQTFYNARFPAQKQHASDVTCDSDSGKADMLNWDAEKRRLRTLTGTDAV